MATAIAKRIPERVLATMPQFLEDIRRGVGPKNAAVAAGWTIKQLRELEGNPQFQEAMEVAKDQLIESVETEAFRLALSGNVPMITMILYNKGRDRGWAPPTQRVAVQHGGSVKVEAIQATKAALRELMAENGATALGYGGPLDAPIIDAEVVDEQPAD
jgi:hypothetical protein